MTKTPRERFDDVRVKNYICLTLSDEEAILGLIETLLEEARQDMKEKCAKKAFDFADNLEKKTGVDASYARAVGNLILSL